MFSTAALFARRTGLHAQRRFGMMASKPFQHISLNNGLSFNRVPTYLRTFAAAPEPELPPLPPTPPKGSPAAHPANKLKGHVNDAQGKYYKDWALNKYINIETVAFLLFLAVAGYGTIIIGERTGLWEKLGVEEYVPGIEKKKKDKHAEESQATKNARDPYQATVTDIVYLDVSIDSEDAGRITLGLFGDVAPKTVENFKSICEGFKRPGHKKFSTLTYAGSPFHRVIPGFMIQGGDITKGNGTGGLSVHGRTFEDETFELRHRQGVLSMANAGPNTNGSQFFLTLNRTDWLDDHHVVFGRVLDGVETVMQISRFGTRSGKPSRTMVISQCGVLDDEDEDKLIELGKKTPNFHWNQ